MTTQAEQWLAKVEVPEPLLQDISAHAHSIDSGHCTTRKSLADIGAAGLADLGTLTNHGTLLDQAAVIEVLAEKSLSVAFSLWCHRMCVEYLSAADTEWAASLLPDLRTGQQVGSSAMAPAFKYAAGIGDLGLHLRRDTTGQLRLSGKLAWASNLFADAVVFAAAYGPTTTVDPVVVAVPLSTPGVEIGPELELLALRGTASTSVTFDDVPLHQDQILTEDLSTFVAQARPILSMLQASFCLGVATESYRHSRHQVAGLNQVFETDLQHFADRLAQVKQRFRELAPTIGSHHPPALAQLLATRLEAGVLAKELTRFETMTAGSRGFVTTSDVNRRYREATFIPLQAPSEAQLRWELAGGS